MPTKMRQRAAVWSQESPASIGVGSEHHSYDYYIIVKSIPLSSNLLKIRHTISRFITNNKKKVKRKTTYKKSLFKNFLTLLEKGTDHNKNMSKQIKS